VVFSTIIATSLGALLLYKKTNGLQRPVWNRYSTSLCFFVITISIIELVVTHSYFGFGNTNWESLQYLEEFPKNSVYMVVFMGCIAAPVIEEAIFRGHLYSLGIKFKIPLFLWMAIVTMIWVILHEDRSTLDLLILFVWGYALAWLRHFSKSIWPCIVIHSTFNSVIWFLPA